MGYKFRIEYKTGASNRVADALSRRDSDAEETGSLLTFMSRPIPRLMESIRRETARLPDMVELQSKIQAGSTAPEFSTRDGIIYFNRRIYISEHSPSKEVVLFEHHSTPLAGHPGVERTFRLVAASFFWPKMRRDVKRFVEECVTCQTTKYSTQKPGGLLQPLPIPSQVWEDISMDFITGLPSSKGFTSIMVVVDRLTKYAHFAALPARFDAPRVARLFIETVVKHHGFPKTLVSDRDPIFLSTFWKELLRLSGTTLHHSTAYHPQSDGQTEVRNRGLEQYLRAFTADRPARWSAFLPWAELALNCFHHDGLGTSPFRALYGREPPSLIAATPSPSTPPDVAEMIRDRGTLLVDLRQNLSQAQQRMRDSANKHRRDVSFEVGDMVLLKLQQYRQHSVARPQSAKLARRFYGPFKILEKVGPVAYRLQLPENCRIHNVFHVSLLRRFVEGSNEQVQTPLPREFLNGRPVVTPVALLDRRIIVQDGLPIEQGLLQWAENASEEVSWEPMDTIREYFPSLLLEDKEVLNKGGADTGVEHSAHTEEEEELHEEREEADSLSLEERDTQEAPVSVARRSQRQRRAPERFADYVSR